MPHQNLIGPKKNYAISIGNQMILSAIWNK